MRTNLKAIAQVVGDVKRSRPDLDRIIHRRLYHVLTSAYLHVPYYKDVMKKAGYNPFRNYSGPEDLALIPVTQQGALRKMDGTSLVKEGQNIDNLFSVTTSGSTGDPLRVYVSPQEAVLRTAKWLRVLFINGYSVFDKVMSLKVPDRMDQMGSAVQRLGMFRRLQTSSLLLPEQIVDAFLAFRPKVVYGSRSVLELMALELKRRRQGPVKVKLLIQHGELINRATQSLCREQFGIELLDAYGSVEMGVMAYETLARDGLHLCEGLTYFEFLDDSEVPVASGEPGRVVVTDLTSTCMPFIRYDQGDHVVFEEAEDNRRNRVRRIVRILGRNDDLMVFSDGTKEPVTALNVVMENFEGITQYRVVQDMPDSWQVFVVADAHCFGGIEQTLLHGLKNRFPKISRFELKRLDRLEVDTSGKIRTFVSKIM
jgi:phenylacetate-coenzyme A ligase PaaK-like adenylate-forming protein